MMLNRRTLCSFLLSLLLIACQTLSVVSDGDRTAEAELRARESATNGITVGMPKVYDDALLQRMLSDAQARLATLQVIDQTGITGRIGGLSGARQSISSFAFNALGAPSPAVTTTSNAGTQTTTQGTTTSVTTGTAGNSNTTTNTVASAIPVENSVTTVPQFNATIPTPPAASTTLPSTFGVSASDILNEQLQLTYEIANLQLLLDGALNDRILTDSEGHGFFKPRVTVGFPIALAPDRRFRGAAAIVEVEVETAAGQNINGEVPGITALLPREKTYNVAAITDRNTSIGAGVITQVAALSGSFLRGEKTYYIVKDQDTLATTFKPKTALRTGFAWHFRPVLGQAGVQSGLKQTFAQIVFPTSKSASQFGIVHVRTYWRKFDATHGMLGAIIPGSVRESEAQPIPRFDMKPTVEFSSGDFEDLGNGQLLVHLRGDFLPGTRVRIGNTLLANGAGLVTDPAGIRFAVSLADVATKKITVLARQGEEQALLVKPCDGDAEHCDVKPFKLKVHSSRLTPVDDSNSLLRIELDPFMKVAAGLDPVVVIGGKVFGYSDAPIVRDGYTINALVPTALAATNREITVRPLFTDDRFAAKTIVVPAEETNERLVLVSQGANLRYILFGRNLTDDLKVLEPGSGTVERVGTGAPTNMRLIQISAADAKTNKNLVLQRPNERAFVLALPPLQPPEPKPAPKFRERIVVGADDGVVVGDGLKDFSMMVALGREFKGGDFTVATDGKSIRITGLSSITSIARTIDCVLVTDAGAKTPIQLEIVTSKVETIPNPK